MWQWMGYVGAPAAFAITVCFTLMWLFIFGLALWLPLFILALSAASACGIIACTTSFYKNGVQRNWFTNVAFGKTEADQWARYRACEERYKWKKQRENKV
jgi:hypothetical protein